MKALIFITLACTIALSTQGQRREVENAIQKKYYDKYGKDGENKLNDWLGGNLGNVKPNDAYNFPVSVTQHITTYEKGKAKDETDITYYVNEKDMTFAMDGSQMQDNKKKKKSSEAMITVFDNANSAMLMFNLSDKTLFAMNMNAFKSKASQEASKKMAEESAGKESDTKCGKTGKTKTILGYSCYEYVCKDKDDEKTYTSMWINSNMKIPEMPYMGAGKVPGTYGKSMGIVGTVLEVDSYQDGELKTTMVVTEINEKADLNLVTADYKMQSMPTVNFGN